MQFRRSREEDDVRLELTSMTDIVFLLLIFFMVSTTFVDFSKRLDIQLPDTSAADVAREAQQHVIELGQDGVLRLDGQVVQLDGLVSQLKQVAQPQRQRSVIIRADKRLPYGRVIEVLGQVRQANIQDIAVAVR